MNNPGSPKGPFTRRGKSAVFREASESGPECSSKAERGQQEGSPREDLLLRHFTESGFWGDRAGAAIGLGAWFSGAVPGP